MRVLVVAEWYPSRADRVHGIWAHRQALAARDAGVEVKVLALRRPIPPIAVARSGPVSVAHWLRAAMREMRPMRLDGLEVQPVPFLAPPRPWSYGSWGAWIAPALGHALAKESFDLVHAHNVLPTGDAVRRGGTRWSGPAPRGGLWSRARGQPPRFVVSTHGPDIIHVAERSPRAATATRRTLQDAAMVIANSHWALARCEALAGGALPAGVRPTGERLPARVVHFGADLPAQAPLRHERPTLVTVAHLQARKRHAEVMQALAEIDPRGRPDYVIVGEGEMRGHLEELRDRLGLGQWVRFLGQLPHEEAMREAWRAHLCVMPSVEEPFGVAYIEAMAGGVPAIGCMGEGGPEDIAASGGGMVMVPRGDHHALAKAIEVCLQDRERLGAAARETVKRAFTWERCGADTVAAYEAALQ